MGWTHLSNVFLTHAWDSQDPTKTLNISGCTFVGNSVTLEDEDLFGGAIVARGGAVTISDTIFQENNGEGRKRFRTMLM